MIEIQVLFIEPQDPRSYEDILILCGQKRGSNLILSTQVRHLPRVGDNLVFYQTSTDKVIHVEVESIDFVMLDKREAGQFVQSEYIQVWVKHTDTT